MSATPAENTETPFPEFEGWTFHVNGEATTTFDRFIEAIDDYFVGVRLEDGTRFDGYLHGMVDHQLKLSSTDRDGVPFEGDTPAVDRLVDLVDLDGIEIY